MDELLSYHSRTALYAEGTRPIFGYRWYAQGLKPYGSFRLAQNDPKIHTLFRTTPSTLLPCLGQEVNACCLVLKPLHLYTSSTNKFHPANQIDSAGNTLLIRTGCLGQTRAKLYTLFSLEQRGQKPYPVQRAHPCLGHMREYHPGFIAMSALIGVGGDFYLESLHAQQREGLGGSASPRSQNVFDVKN